MALADTFHMIDGILSFPPDILFIRGFASRLPYSMRIHSYGMEDFIAVPIYRN